MRQGGRLTLGAIAVTAAILNAGWRASAASTTQPVGFAPLSDQAAAALVQPAAEVRPLNSQGNHTVPSPRMVKAWRKHNKMPYRRFRRR